MKKFLVISALAFGALSAAAQAIEAPSFWNNWSLGLQGGAASPIEANDFIKSTRAVVGATLDKQVTPVLAVGAEGVFGINTSAWGTHSSTVFDNSYVGAYGAIDLFNLLGGYKGHKRAFTIEVQAGAGWGHTFLNSKAGKDHNFFATKAGVNFNFNLSNSVSLNISPSVIWDMSDNHVKQTSAAYDSRKAVCALQAGLTWHMGGTRFEIVRPYNQAEIDVLNGQINDLRGQLETALNESATWESKATALDTELQNCLSRPAVVKTEIKTEVNNTLNSVRYVFYKIGSSSITADQQPNVEMIADYLKNHPSATVVIKGYASKDGNEELNIRLAAARAQAVKDALINRYKISPKRITAEGEGIGEMFEEESWNRVSICTIEQADKK